MKKNTMMRMAALLLVAVLLTTCVISGTFAKYVTEASAQDSARVAKFGVFLTVTGDDIFNNEYTTDDTSSYSGTVSVKAEKKVVAPGTKSDEGLKFSINGTPEVAVKVELAFEVENDIFLKGGPYTDFTQAPYVGSGAHEFTVSDEYRPVVFSLTKDSAVVASGAIDEIKAYFATDSSAIYDPQYTINTEYALTWAWAFEGVDSAAINKADTMLGNLVVDSSAIPSGAILPDDDEFCTELAYKLTIKVTQID